MQAIQRMTPKERHERQIEKYRELIEVTEEVVTSAQKVVEQTRKARGKDLVAEMAAPELRKEIDHYCELGERVIETAISSGLPRSISGQNTSRRSFGAVFPSWTQAALSCRSAGYLAARYEGQGQAVQDKAAPLSRREI